MKAAVASGAIRRFVVGDPAIQWLDVIAGAPLARMAEAEHFAEKGGVVADGDTARAVEDRIETGTYAVAAASFCSASRSGNQLQMVIAAGAGQRYALERSTNLNSWTPLTTNTVPASRVSARGHHAAGFAFSRSNVCP